MRLTNRRGADNQLSAPTFFNLQLRHCLRFLSHKHSGPRLAPPVCSYLIAQGNHASITSKTPMFAAEPLKYVSDEVDKLSYWKDGRVAP